VLVTFDDGYRSVYTLALPVLRRHGVPATVFVCSGAIERRSLFWFDAAARAGGLPEVERLKGLPYAAWQQEVARLDLRPGDGDPLAPMAVDELRALAAAPGIEIGGHTATHPILARAGRAEQRREIGDDKRRLEEWLQAPVTAFAYPNGRPGLDYTTEAVDLLRREGYAEAFTTRHGFSTPGEPPLERSRIFIVAALTATELAHRLCYSWTNRARASAS
jgi:peptidoglycan/xylan/chitin deacetylase (PgdA/CDA1 family)